MASMKLFAIVVLAAMASATSSSNFDEFRVTFEKDYASPVEVMQRRLIFEDNLKKIEAHNALYAKGEVTYSMGVNQFTDMTEDELSSFNYGLPKITEEMAAKMAAKSPVKLASTSAAGSKGEDRTMKFSWRDSGVVTSVKNQKQCGSCAAFATTASVESCFNIKAGKKVVDDLSEQFLNDCGNGHIYVDKDGNRWGASGCSGAWPQSYMDLIYNKNNGFDETEAYYPYVGRDATCKWDSNGNYMGETVKGQEFFWYSMDDARGEEQLLDMLSRGVVATTFQVSNSLNYYNGGIYTDNTNACSGGPNYNNHAVAVVGYGTDAATGMKYWEVKNSWGGAWGEQGFFRIQRGVGLCGFGIQMATRAKC